MAQVRKWIASRIDADPMLLRTFGQQYISDNFWGYDDIVVKDQYYVDKAQGDLSEGRGTYVDEDVQGWEIDDETLGRVDEWALAIDNMYQGMQEFGKTALTTTGGQTIPNSTAPTTTCSSLVRRKASGDGPDGVAAVAGDSDQGSPDLRRNRLGHHRSRPSSQERVVEEVMNRREFLKFLGGAAAAAAVAPKALAEENRQADRDPGTLRRPWPVSAFRATSSSSSLG
jgi:hypothetical protein